MVRILSIVLTVNSNPLLSTFLINNLPDLRKGKVGVNLRQSKMLIKVLLGIKSLQTGFILTDK